MKEKPQIELTDKEVDELNTTFCLHFTREEWLLKLTTRPSYESLVRSYYQWHVSDLMSRIPEGCPVPPNLSDVQAPYPPMLQGEAESEARRRAGLFLIQTIRPIREDNEALLEREKLLSAPLPNGERPEAPFMRRVIYLAGAWYHRVDAMDADGQAALKAYLLKAWPPYQGEPITQTRLEDWRLSDYVIGITKENSTLN